MIAGVTAVSGGSSYSTSTTELGGNSIGANSIAVRFRSADVSTTAKQGVATVGTRCSRMMSTTEAQIWSVTSLR